MYTSEGQLTAAPPFDFSKSLAFLGEFPPMRAEQTLAGRTLVKAIDIAGQPIVFRLIASDAVEAPRIAYTLFSDRPIAEPVQRAALDRVRFFLSLDDDLQPFYAIASADPPFAPILERLYGYHQVKFLTPFENTCWAILTQRTPMATARRIKQALVDRFGVRLEVEGVLYQAFPAAASLAAVGVDEWAALIDNQRKVEYLAASIAAFSAIDEQWLRTAPYDEVESWLRAIKGIGPWSASFVLLRGLGRMDRVPVGEERLAEAVSRCYAQGRSLSEQEVTRIAERYGPWQGYWAHYLRAAY